LQEHNNRFAAQPAQAEQALLDLKQHGNLAYESVYAAMSMDVSHNHLKHASRSLAQYSRCPSTAAQHVDSLGLMRYYVDNMTQAGQKQVGRKNNNHPYALNP
jgi:hypothetical protein